ncbi:hypothetical protein [Nostoc sp.]|uniref:hypothetical protein n=1 Tax=Nostoc sp. TaxID=1180 RepID=UPI002FF6ADB5
MGERFFSANEAQKECAARFVQFIPQLKTLQKHINDAIANKVLAYRSIRQLLGDNYELLNRQRREQRSL